MTFNVMDFESPQALAKFVVDEELAQGNIQAIWCRGTRWYLFYWE